MRPSEVRAHFIDVLAAFYGMPKHPDAIAMLVAPRCPPTMAPDELKACANHLLETRKGKTWPEPRELFATLNWRPPANPPPQPGTFKVFVSSDDPRWPDLVKRFKRERGKSPPSNGSKLGQGWFFPPAWIAAVGTSPPQREREANAIRLLRTSPELAANAVANRWAPALIEFVTKNGREPSPDEETALIAGSHRNNASVATEPGKIGEQLRQLRQTMHDTAAARLGLPDQTTPKPANDDPQPRGAIETSRLAAEQNLERLKAEAANPDLAKQLAPSKELLRSLTDKAKNP